MAGTTDRGSLCCATEPIFGGFKTLGGPVFWTDQIIHGGWRIQRNVVFGKHRLLDPSERKIASGSFDKCYHELDRRRICGEIAPLPSHVVIVMHGLAGTRKWMAGMAEFLEEEGGYTVLNFGFASTKGTIQQQAAALRMVLCNLKGVQEVSFVCHSMSNIMVRHLLYRFQEQGISPPVRFRRMVMISPPNHGARLAGSVGQRAFFQCTLGEVVDQFAPCIGWPDLERQLLTPNFEFGILAGGKGDRHGYLNRIVGDDDAVISLSTHLLRGAKDFKQVGGYHQLMPKFYRTQCATLKFLKCGHF